MDGQRVFLRVDRCLHAIENVITHRQFGPKIGRPYTVGVLLRMVHGNGEARFVCSCIRMRQCAGVIFPWGPASERRHVFLCFVQDVRADR